MPRIRSIHYDALKSEKLSACSAEAERCYYRLLTQCDDAGRAEDDPRVLKSFCFPLFDIMSTEVDGWLQELHDRGLIARYAVNGRRILQFTRWSDYQKPQHPTPSKLPGLENADPQEPVEEKPHEDSGGLTHGGELRGVGDGVVLAEVIHILGLRDFQSAKDDGIVVRNRQGYLTACIETRRQLDRSTVLHLLADHPDWDPEQIADEVDNGHSGRLRVIEGGATTIDGRTFLPGTGWVGEA